MATNKPRITVTLEPRVYEVLRAISDNSGQSMSYFISDMLSTNYPIFERMAVSFQRIASQRELHKREIGETLQDAESALAPLLEQAIAQFDMFTSKVEGVLGVQEAVPTPLSNRGVRNDQTDSKKPIKSRSSVHKTPIKTKTKNSPVTRLKKEAGKGA